MSPVPPVTDLKQWCYNSQEWNRRELAADSTNFWSGAVDSPRSWELDKVSSQGPPHCHHFPTQNECQVLAEEVSGVTEPHKGFMDLAQSFLVCSRAAGALPWPR